MSPYQTCTAASLIFQSLSKSLLPPLLLHRWRRKTDGSFDGRPLSQLSLLKLSFHSILPSPPPSVPLLWVSLSCKRITQPPLGSLGQGGRTRRPDPEAPHPPSCHSNAAPLPHSGPCGPGRLLLSAGLGLLISC